MSEAEKNKAQLVIVTGLVVLYFIFKAKPFSMYFLYAAAIVGVLCIVLPVVGDFIVKIWYKIAEGLGWVNSRVILSVLFFVFLWPIAMLYKLGAKNPMQRKRLKESSVFFERNHTYTPKDLEQIW
jgi:Saxitoxin biosynthesis operon protein SxtJ